MASTPRAAESLPERVRLVVLFGGRSAEHDISRISASHVLRAVDPDRYEVVPVGITRAGRWQLAEEAAGLVRAGRQSDLPESLAIDGTGADPWFFLHEGPAWAPPSPGIPTVVLPILHGPNGEDGTVQGLLEVADVPYVGAGVLGSAVAMDKATAKTLLGAHGIAQVRWCQLSQRDLDDPDLAGRLTRELGPVLFVKPANMGSSIGVVKVTEAAQVVPAVEHALEFDDVVVVEEGATVRELECAVLGNEDPQASVVGEIVPAADFYDFDDKYADGAAATVIPADIDPGLAEAARDLALRTYRALRAEGMARVDMFLEEPGRGLLVNEINTIPGFTPISMYPKLWDCSGLGYSALIDELVALALERHARRGQRRTER
ncbi:MAG: D-alanine--D-alanine ligase family protein [Actinomycetes bacterium]